ncbi:pancreatic triacylglycerol lipase-like [Maniola jurtina]|uniref:pancreatic triacylglycerol lipase-like n=1 Tax=Maniola jurtina TaxID=191418 RepID=UPI001E688023|nr:pancreatic triacylglycerol lipase-like [Maniola jurtina]
MLDLFYLLLPYTLATAVSAGVTAKVTEVPAMVRAEVPAEVTEEVMAEVPVDFMAEVTAEVPAEVMAETPSEVIVELPAEVTSEATAGVTHVTADGSAVASEGLADEWEWMEALAQGVQKEIQAVKQPIDEAVINVGFSVCEHVQKLLGISYEQMKGEKTPDLDSLALLYRTRYSTTIMNISAAPEVLSRVRQLDHDKRLVIFAHGFRDDPTKDVFNNLTQSFFAGNHLSLLALDASPLIQRHYYRSSTYVRFIGHKLGQVLADMVQYGQDPSLIHIIGYSLGAHIAGFAGKHFNVLTGKLIGRISGLDPAGPCFSHVAPALRLKHTDAMYVDVMHTDAGVFGIKAAVGHKDYYPNSGSMQPNCLFPGCSHTRTWLMYGESVVYPFAFPAKKCKDWEAFKKGECDPGISYMGYQSQPGPAGSNGSYFLYTDGNYPYGMGLEGIKYKNNDGIIQTIGNYFGGLGKN